MLRMFQDATSFSQKLCGASWVDLKASTLFTFQGSSGSIADTLRTPALTAASKLVTSQYVSRQPMPERELIVRTLITAPVSTPSVVPTITYKMTCPKCGMFKKSGRVSCCAPGGAWYKKCGGSGNRNVDHRWFEGVDTCKRKSKVKGMYSNVSIDP